MNASGGNISLFPDVLVPGIRCLAVLLILACGATNGVAQSSTITGHWEGALTYRGDEMVVRIHVESGGDTLRATLDIPSMVMAWEPIAAKMPGDSLALKFPFGMGELKGIFRNDEGYFAKAAAEDTLTLRLERTAAPPFVRQDVRFSSDGIELAGTLVVPNGERPHPAVVLLHGSGRQGRDKWVYRSWADLLVRQGLAVLYYDKRGVGESGGEYEASLRQLADDGIAAVQFLRSRREVDPRRIGLKGSSQGAWLAEQVAADLEDMSFLLLVSGAAVTPRQQELQKIEYGMRADGHAAALIEDALAYYGLYFFVARTGEGWSLLETAVKRAQTEEWGQYVDQPRSEADLAWWRENHALQPAELVQGLDLPALLLYGGADWIAPPIENAEKLRSLFPSPERIEVHVFPGADHRLELDMGPDEHGVWHWPRIAPGMRPAVAEWLQKHKLN